MRKRDEGSEQLPCSNRITRKISEAPRRKHASASDSNKKTTQIKPRWIGLLLFGIHDFDQRQPVCTLPKFSCVDTLCLVHDRVWATPSKNDAFISRKDSNTVKTSFDEVDSTLCDVDAPQASSINIEIDPSVGEQDPKYSNSPHSTQSDVSRHPRAQGSASRESRHCAPADERGLWEGVHSRRFECGLQWCRSATSSTPQSACAVESTSTRSPPPRSAIPT